jgi:hypothetical protein
MFDEPAFWALKRHWIAAAILVALTAACCLTVWVAPAAADSTCATGNVCAWTQTNFEGVRGNTNCGAQGAHPLGGFKYSAKNHCAARAVWLRFNGGAVECLEPNQQDGAITFNELWVGAELSHC